MLDELRTAPPGRPGSGAQHDPARSRGRPERIEHTALGPVLMDMWRYVEACEFFHDAVCRAAEQVNGEVGPVS